jgi:hypothetical protein
MKCQNVILHFQRPIYSFDNYVKLSMLSEMPELIVIITNGVNCEELLIFSIIGIFISWDSNITINIKIISFVLKMI